VGLVVILIYIISILQLKLVVTFGHGIKLDGILKSLNAIFFVTVAMAEYMGSLAKTEFTNLANRGKLLRWI